MGSIGESKAGTTPTSTTAAIIRTSIYTKVRNALTQRKELEERIKDVAEILRKRQDIHEGIDGKERNYAFQKEMLENAARKIGLDDEMKKDILTVFRWCCDS